MGTTSTQPNPAHIPTDSVDKQILYPNTTVENVALSKVQNSLQIKRCEDIHKVYRVFQRLIEVLVDLVEKGALDVIMGDGSGRVPIVWVVRGVLHQTVQYVVAFRGQGFVKN